ncbi:homogentisate 1,2-dioxygenase [Sphingomonas bacterium]|uniref:homogentisate 1,2-dioxygenase n=1 Tax=Sphingomonas bacterium TaxID=1895847 RepID=UPI0015754D68|nr:homogentisate 1,2-dioxygenase [Sphingomonas bacterium]
MAWWMIAAALASGAPAQDAMAGMAMKPAAACPATPAPLPADYAGWPTMTALKAGAKADAAAGLTLGTGARVTLLPTPQVTYAATMKHMGTPADFGGSLAFLVVKPGRYRVSLGAAAWIDVVQGATVMTSVAHGHGPDCSGIRKIVEFDLTPGAYLLQVAGNTASTLGVMVAPVTAAAG